MLSSKRQFFQFDQDAAKHYAKNMKIGLALSGGGALGAAHIGVLEELERNNIKIDEIAGTSAGAIVAAIYAHSGLEALIGFFEKIAKLDIFSQKRPFNLTTPAKLYEAIFEIVDKYTDENLEDAKIPIYVTATDIKSGDCDTFSSGNTIAVLKASCAYPAVFPMQSYKDSKYIDGGITCNLPSEVLRPNVDFLIGSNLYGISELSDKEVSKLNRITTLVRSLDVIQRQLADLYARECDFCFQIAPNYLKWYSFNKIEPIKNIGLEQARDQLPGLLQALNK